VYPAAVALIDRARNHRRAQRGDGRGLDGVRDTALLSFVAEAIGVCWP
jgi:hypothetical protein